MILKGGRRDLHGFELIKGSIWFRINVARVLWAAGLSMFEALFPNTRTPSTLQPKPKPSYKP